MLVLILLPFGGEVTLAGAGGGGKTYQMLMLLAEVSGSQMEADPQQRVI